MDLIRPFARYVVTPAWAKWEGSPYLRHYRALKRSQFDPPEVVRERQLCAVRDMLAHAAATVPFYRERLQRHGIRPEEIRSFDDFRGIPLLTKRDIREHGDDLLSESYQSASLHRKTTSGSTGVPLVIKIDDEGMQFKRACTLRSDEWSGWQLGGRVAKVWGNPEYQKLGWRGRFRNWLLDRATYLDTLQLTDESLATFARTLKRYRPALIFGHAHSVYLFAEYIRNHGPNGIRPDGIITSAMVLHDWQRRTIEDVFGCKVTNRYGCEEVSLIASECENHSGLHVNADSLYVEVLCNGRPAVPGESGAVVITDLANRAMPLIRYKVGDVAAMSSHVCPCGRGLPMLERLEGRESDYVTSESGELISGISLTENFALHIPGVAQIQIVQESITQFHFRIVRDGDFDDASHARLRFLVRERFGPNTRYDVEFLDEIPQEASGKYRFCISKVPVTI